MKKSNQLTLFLLLFLPIYTIAQNKLALIIGNDKYLGQYYSSLHTSINDADSMAYCFKQLGYETIVCRDGNKNEIEKDANTFMDKLKQGNISECVFYYSGHSIGKYIPRLVPAKTIIGEEKSMENIVYYPEEVLRTMSSYCKYSFFFVDGCRKEDSCVTESDFIKKALINKSKNEQKFCFSTEPNKPSYSTLSNGLSPFTKVLKAHLFDEDVFENVWKKIVGEVLRETDGKQKPTDNDTWVSDFVFNKIGFNPLCIITLNVQPKSEIEFGFGRRNSGEAFPIEKGKEYSYIIQHDGYETYYGIIKIKKNDTTNHIEKDIFLNPQKNATLKVECLKPKKAKVYIDGDYFGTTPLNISTTSGVHAIEIRASKYYKQDDIIKLSHEKNNTYRVKLKHEPIEWFDFDEYDKAAQINYHFSPKNRFILSSMYRKKYSHWSFGAIITLHGIGHRLFGEIDKIDNNIDISQSSTITLKSSKDTVVKEQPYDVNAGFLGNVGYSICNGVMIEGGLGGYFHEERYCNEYTITSVRGNNMQMTQTESLWSSRNAKWSPAIRLGARFFIPLDNFNEDSHSISLGGGYTYLPMNNKCSYWDVSIGLSWYF